MQIQATRKMAAVSILILALLIQTAEGRHRWGSSARMISTQSSSVSIFNSDLLSFY